MADFIQALDPAKLVLVGTALSFATCAFAAPPYNLPIFLFGHIAQESSEAIQSLQLFTALVTASGIYDIVWLARNQQNWFMRTLTILILLLKVPTALAFATSLRQRGAQFSGLGGLGVAGNNLTGATVWSMPGGFTSGGGGGGYQSMDDPEPTPTPRAAAPPAPANHQTAPGAYQSV